MVVDASRNMFLLKVRQLWNLNAGEFLVWSLFHLNLHYKVWLVFNDSICFLGGAASSYIVLMPTTLQACQDRYCFLMVFFQNLKIALKVVDRCICSKFCSIFTKSLMPSFIWGFSSTSICQWILCKALMFCSL